MRKITVLSMITLDGVLQLPGGPEKDTEGGFNYGGWVAPYDNEVYREARKASWHRPIIFWAEKHFSQLLAHAR